MKVERELGCYYLECGALAIREPGTWVMYFEEIGWSKIFRPEGIADLDESIHADMIDNNALYLGPL